MTPERHQQAGEIFLEARALDPAGRARLLAERCGSDTDLRAAVDWLLKFDEGTAAAESTLDMPSRPPALAGLIAHAGERHALPESIGPYRLLEMLGEGGMGIVYLAERTDPIRQRVAVKAIKPGMDSREVLARFEAERQALALMSHPNVAQVHDAGTTADGRPYFVMEYVPGIPITEYCDRHLLSTRERLELFIPVCEAVQHAHQKAIIHRDLKPSNILVKVQDQKPVPKVIDFGVAKATNQRLTEKTFFTEHGRLIGTPEYMSPEQAEMSSLDIDTRTDIFSLGVILYELLAGTLPFDPKELRQAGYAELQRRIRETDPPRPSTRLNGLGPESASVAQKRRTDTRSLVNALRGDLDWITMKAMEKDRTRRFASASELAADVQRHLRFEPVSAGRPSAIYRLRKLARKHRKECLGLALLLLALLGVFAAGRLDAARDRQRRLDASHALRREGEAAAQEFRRLRQEVTRLHDDWIRAKDASKPSARVWRRGEEIRAWEALKRSSDELAGLYERAVLSLQRAIDSAPDASEPRGLAARALETLYMERYRDTLTAGPIQLGPSFFKALVDALALGTYASELSGETQVELHSVPSGVAVHVFRWVQHEGRLVPLPLAHSASASAETARPFLRVARLLDAAAAAPLAAGDRLLSINGRELLLRSDLARAIEASPPGSRLELTLQRDGKPMTLGWTPRRSPQGEALIDSREAGFLLEGAPLDFGAGSRHGVTDASGRLALKLLLGSYVLVLRKPGYHDTRLPIVAGNEAGAREVELVLDENVPPGFVLVPGGPVHLGGDELAYNGLAAGVRDVPSFFLQRREVTFGEYLEFVNAPENAERIDSDGKAELRGDWTSPELAALRPDDGKVCLIPGAGGAAAQQLFLNRDAAGGKWILQLTASTADSPLAGISFAAGVEYAHWLSGRESRWRYRLPRDEEWEKAARGADQRLFVWGSYPLISDCHSYYAMDTGLERPRLPASSEMFPLDESPYGVVDMAGSMAEPTIGSTLAKFHVWRGGYWEATDVRDYRVATRNRGLPSRNYRHLGLRLAADVRGGAGGK